MATALLRERCGVREGGKVLSEHGVWRGEGSPTTTVLQEVSLRHPSVFAITALASAGLLGVGCGSSSNSGSANNAAATSTPAYSAPASAPATTTAAAAGTAVGTIHTKLGTILVAGPKHMTVYLFEADKGTTSNCSSACAQAWPPVTTTGEPKAEGGAKASSLGTTERSDGTRQVTYHGHPLYYYVSDQSSGETTGQGVNSFGADWYVMSPKGGKIDNS
jgi:predicted lipoprotein with Yx(FWY)xxD motif